MNSMLFGLLAETSLHFGSGSSEGAIDLPLAREAATNYPVLVGSSLKGALRDWARRAGWLDPDVKQLFGDENQGGAVIVSDARLLLLPVRSLTSSYRWVTCPMILERLARDARRSNLNSRLNMPPQKELAVPPERYLGAGPDTLYLEELEFQRDKELPGNFVDCLKQLIFHGDVAERLARDLVVINDKDFAWFAAYGLPVTARNQLTADTKTSNNLWYEETLPPDTLMYTMLFDRRGNDFAGVRQLISAEKPYLQVGGNETVGQGWVALKEVR